MLEFDAKTTRLLETAYQGADFSRRRTATRDALRPVPGDRILDIGCGNGLLTLELARAVGAEGRVIGVDPSADMRAPAIERCRDQDHVSIVEGTAATLPCADASIDKAAALQVFEYLDDIPAALGECRRVLKAGGLLVIGDMHWDSLVWHADDPQTMTRMIWAWDGHLADRCVPARLPELLGEAGFAVEHVSPLTFCDTCLRPDGLANMMIHLMEPYAVQNGLVEAPVARGWAEEQRAMASEGRFFFSLTHFVVTARKP